MDPRNLYILFYKQGNQGVKSGLLVASSQDAAETLGRSFCNTSLNRRFIRVESAILAEEGAPIQEEKEAAAAPEKSASAKANGKSAAA